MDSATLQKQHLNGKNSEGEGRRRSSTPTPTQLLDATDGQPLVSAALVSAARSLIVERPGTCLIAGVVVGGILGWLTSKLR